MFEHREGISLDRVREARRNFQKFVSSEAEKGEENKQIGRVMNYEDNIQSMYGKKSSTYQFEEYMNMQMNSIDLSLTDFCHKSIQKFITSHTIAKMRITMYRSLNEELKNDIKLCPKVLLFSHRDIFIMFHSCRYISKNCTCGPINLYATFNRTIEFTELSTVIGKSY